jgi:predicted Zn-dependent protease
MSRFVKLNWVLILGGAVATFACAFGSSDQIQLNLQQDLTVVDPKGVRSEKHKGDRVTVGNTPLLLESPGHVDVLVVPISGSSDKQIDVSLKATSSSGDPTLSPEFDSSVNQLISDINEAQILLLRSQGAEALARVEELQSRYPRVSYLRFLKASCLLVTGANDRAKAALESALHDFPNNAAGLALYQQLSHGVDQRKPATTEQKSGEVKQ